MKSIRKNMLYALALAILLAGLVIPALAATTTTTVDSAGDVGRDTSLALNSLGLPIISYHDATNDDLKIAICENPTCTNRTITVVDGVGTYVGAFTSLALNSSDFPVISYYDVNHNDLKIAICGSPTCSTSNVISVIDNGPGEEGWYTSLELDNNDFPVISYFDATNQDLKLAICSDSTCATRVVSVIDSTGDVGRFTSLTLSDTNFPVISYYDLTNGNLKIAICNDTICSSKTITTLDSLGDVGRYSSVELSSSKRPIVSYTDSSNGNLKLAICGDVTCSSGNIIITVDDSAGNVGYFTSLDLNDNDFPVISYYDSSNSNLKLALCGDTTCSANNKILTTIDNPGLIGFFTSLLLNNNRTPIISYFDNTNSDLKLAIVTPPTVTNHTLQTNYADTGPLSFTITFSEDVHNPTGDTNTDDVTNPNNYVVVEQGSVSGFQTTACNAIDLINDTRIIPNGITYIPNTAIVNFSNALPSGTYRLFICGTTSITDAIGIPLNLGADFTFDFTVGAATASSTTESTRASALPKTGFAPNKMTSLPAQPATLEYANMGDLWLEIPSLNVKSTIVGVPQNKDKTWDVTWLGNDTGWLNGTAFPTWTGNSVLTAHVTNASGLAGPFAALKSLKYGDQIIVHMGGGQYVYEVRNTRLARPYSTSYAFQSMQDASYLTLVTCSGFNPLNESYLFRRVVRAVLVEVK